MQKLSLSYLDIIEALSGADPRRRQEALRQIFENDHLRQMTLAHVRGHGGNRQDGEDVFQEAIILFDRKIREGRFRGESSLETYFMGIARWHWFNTCQHFKNKKTELQSEPPEPPPDGDPELEYLLQERRENIQTLLDQLTDKCRKLLKMYQLDYSMEEIAAAMGYANGGVAKKEAFLCRQRFRALLEAHPEIWREISN